MITADEREWLDGFRDAVSSRFPAIIEDIIVFGSKARGTASADSDLDVLVLLREGDRSLKSEIRRLGHRLAVTSDAVPSIMIYTRAEWLERRDCGSPLFQAVSRDGVSVA